MWNEVIDETDLKRFMERVYYFHDSCIKELKYLSGAYVNDALEMHPINDIRTLNLVLQRQFENDSMIELKFEGLNYLRLVPDTEQFTCEILDSTMILKNNQIYWCDCGDISETDLKDYQGTLICASKLKWRVIQNRMGQEEFYIPAL